MSLISFVIILAVIGVLLYLFNLYVTMIDPRIKWLINAVVIVAVVVWCLGVFGVWDDIGVVRVPRV